MKGEMRKTTRDIQDEKREVALADIRAQVSRGTLTVRQMTSEERARYARDASPKRDSRRGA